MFKRSPLTLFHAFIVASIATASLAWGATRDDGIIIDIDYPGGNALVETDTHTSTLYFPIEGDTVRFRSDLRDTPKEWFYWNFRVSGAAGRTLRFELTYNKLGAFGPAVSLNGGKSWSWLHETLNPRQTAFTYTFGANDNEVRFASVIPYLQTNLDTLLAEIKNNPLVNIGSLTTSEKGRNIEKILIKNPIKDPQLKVLLSARHHACESMASYLLEGIITATLEGNSDAMAWLRENVEFLILPMMDKDGVEDGDQGKNRAPWDHNEDYLGPSIYRAPAALRELAPMWADGKLRLALDLHCPGLAGSKAENFFAVGSKVINHAAEQRKFMDILLERQSGELKLNPANALLEFGTSWNVARRGSGPPQTKSSREWYSEIEGVKMSATMELPYANNEGQMVTPQNARELGSDLANAISLYLQNL